MERPWLLLDRVLHAVAAAPGAQAQEEENAMDVEDADEVVQAQLEESVVNANTDAAAAAAAHAAHGAGPPTFTISVDQPPWVSSVFAWPSSHPEPASPDTFPYILAAGRFCLLVHFSEAPFYSADFGGGEDPIPGHLVAVRHFRRDEGQIAACAVRVPDRPDDDDDDNDIPGFLGNMNSVGLVCDQPTGHFQIAELFLATDDAEATLVHFTTETGVWQADHIESPFDAANRSRVWVPHGTLAINSTVLWFDLSWGIISCDLDEPDRWLTFHRLPHGRVLRDGNAPDLHSRRCVAVSENLVRYVEIIIPSSNNPLEAATVNMWYRDVENEPDRWITNYREISFAGIWDDVTYVQTGLPRNPPMLVGVSPVDSNVVYFTLNNMIFGVNVPQHRVVDWQVYQTMDRPRPLDQQDEPATSRYLITWNLDADAAINVGHMQNQYLDHADSSEGGAMDEGEIDYQSE